MKQITKRTSDELVRALLKARTVAICSHVSPDGDTIGSALALRLGLLQLGKRVRCFCQDKVPDLVMMLPGADTVEHAEDLRPEDRFDAVITVDVSDDDRMGDMRPLLERGDVTLLVDHHGTDPGFCEIDVIDGDAPACCLLIYELLRRLGVTVGQDIAACLYAGIATDTGNFSFAYTTPEAFRVTAALMETGFPMSDMNRRLFRQRDPAQLLLIRAALETLTFERGGRLAWMQLRRADFEACGALDEHADTIVNFGMDLKGARMAMLAREDGRGGVKFSLRSITPWRVDRIAKALGGGGHDQAAGVTLQGTLEEAVPVVVEAMCRALDAEND